MNEELKSLLSRAESQGIQLWVEADKLRYRYPTGTIEQDLIAELKMQKEAIIGHLANQIETFANSGFKFRRQPRSRLIPWYYPVLWEDGIVGKSDPNVRQPRFIVRLKLPTSVENLIETLNILVARHEALRCRAVILDNKCFLSVDEKLQATIDRLDLATEPEETRLDAAKKYISDAISSKYNIETDPLYRAIIVSLGQNYHIFALQLHHAIADGFSINLLFQEFFTVLDTIEGERALSLSKPSQYPDYLLSMKSWLDSMHGQVAVKSLVDQLKGATPTTLSEILNTVGIAHTQQIAIDSALSNSLHILARRLKTTVFILLLVAQKIAIRQITGQKDITLLHVTAARQYPRLGSMVGQLSNEEACRTHIRDDVTFDSVVAMVKDSIAASKQHQPVPFNLIREELAKMGQTLIAPVFNFFPINPEVSDMSLHDRGTLLYLPATGRLRKSKPWNTYGMQLSGDSRGIKGSIVYRDEIEGHKIMRVFLDRFMDILKNAVINEEIK